MATTISVAEGKERARDYGTGSDLSNYILGIFEAFISARLPWEQLWEECWYNYLGQYSPATVWRKTEGTGTRSRIFVKVTTLKCNTAHSKIIDVLFQGKGEAPFDLKAIDTDLLGIPPEQAADIVAKSKQRLRDHFREISLEEILDTEILAMAILGTGVLKGPIVEMQRKHVVRQRMIGGMPITDIDPEAKGHEIVTMNQTVPVLDGIPLWEYYTDINAKSTKDAIGEIHFQRLLPAHFRRFAYQPSYNKEAVLECVSRPQSDHPQDKRYIVLGDKYMGTIGAKDERIPALEWWGLTPAKYLRAEGAEVPDDVDDDEDVEALTVLGSDGIVCKATMNPLGWRPFYVCPYKKRPHVIYGMGVSEMMRDSQKMVNSATRIYIDNKALSGNAMIGVNKDRIDTKRTTNLEVYPGKTWWTKGQFAPKEAIDSVKIEDVTQGIREMIELFMRFSDEETGIPKYTSGESDSFLNKTASGMSMLMSQANINLKTVMKNIDNEWIEPIVEAFYRYYTEIEPVMKLMPLKIVATGADSLMAREIKLENLIKTKQAMASPQDAMFIDNVKLNRQLFRLLETEDVMKTDEEIKGIMQTMTELAKQPRDLREMLDIDRLYPYLMKGERMQVLQQIGLEPDPNQPEGLLVELIELAKAARKGNVNQPAGPVLPGAGMP